MKKSKLGSAVLAALLILAATAAAQFTPEELATWAKWEEFLKTAEVVDQKQIIGREAVTSPWKLTLEKDGVQNLALWKDIVGRVHGFQENWKWEIASYLIDRHLGLNMVPPTVEREFKGRRGSCQFWVDAKMSLREKMEKDIPTPSVKVFYWNRALFLQRFFDNLIANEDRHQNNFLITEDWRLILIDHSRSFRTSKKFTKALIYTDKYSEGPREMKEIPRALVEKIKALDAETLKNVVGEYLTEEEIEAVLIRRDLMLAEFDRLVKKYGEDKVFY